MDQYNYKGRLRTVRGQLFSFDNLPSEKQFIFKSIKKFLVDYLGKDLDVYVYGSYLHGLWDEESDYDVIVKNQSVIPNIDEAILEILNVKVNVVFLDADLSSISIP